MTFRCEYCGRNFKREGSAVKHMCTQKQRHLQKTEQHIRLGHKFFNDWYRRSMGIKKDKTYEEFACSQYYAAFVRFGLYTLESRVLAPERYLEWLVVNKIKLEQWSKDSVYNQYLADASKQETPERALERFVLHAQEWSDRTGRHWSTYWNDVNENRMVYDIKMGKISPWVFLAYPPAQKRLDGLPREMLIEVADTVDLGYWNRKIEVNKPTVAWINEIMP